MSTHLLPPELWRIILRIANYAPFVLDLEWKYGVDEHLWAGWDTHGPAVDSLSEKTKRAVVLVCRSWREMAVEYLYENIQIPPEPSEATQLVEVMRRSASDSERGYG